MPPHYLLIEHLALRYINTYYFVCSGMYESLNTILVFVLVLAGIELIFFLVAGIGLCFGLVLETVLVTQRCFGHCWAVLTQSSGPSCPSHRPTGEWAGGARGAGRGHSRDS